MKYSLVAILAMLAPISLHAADVSFLVVPSDIPNDGAIVIEMLLKPDVGDPSLNALEGRIGFLGAGSEAITDVVVETGDSALSLWPELPRFEATERIIRFTGGVPVELPDSGGIVLRLRLFTASREPITVSWLGGAAYAADGIGTPVGITSRSLVVVPEIGVPNPITPTSMDSKPPIIKAAVIAQDPDVFANQYFLSIEASDDATGIAYFEVIEGDQTTRFENGPYVLKDQSRQEPLLLIAYDKAGNSTSMRVTSNESADRRNVLFIGVVMLLVMLAFYRLRRKK